MPNHYEVDVLSGETIFVFSGDTSDVSQEFLELSIVRMFVEGQCPHTCRAAPTVAGEPGEPVEIDWNSLRRKAADKLLILKEAEAASKMFDIPLGGVANRYGA